MSYETKPGVRLPEAEDARPKRFYETVEISGSDDDGWSVLLDGRKVKTPARQALNVPSEALADHVAREWREQGERIDAAGMPVTRLVFVALDRMGEAREATEAEITRYASTDLLCFRAPEPTELVSAQAAAWDPMLAWIDEALGCHLVPATGLLPVDQDPIALQRVHERVGQLSDLALTATAHATAVCGSAVLGLALLEGRIDGAQAFALSTVDEHFQMSHWGEDAEAAERLAGLKAELIACEQVLRALGDGLSA
ncbi:ATP12 family chaperone protein [Maricaulis sp. CAU 1757]